MANAGFYRFETETMRIELEPSTALRDYKDVVVSIRQSGTKEQIDIMANDLEIDAETGVLQFHLDQAQTGRFRAGTAVLQVNIFFVDRERDTSITAILTVHENLYEKVMT